MQNHEVTLIAEQSVIGAIILDEKILAQVSGIIRPSDFYFEELKACYEAILKLSEQGKAIDFLTVLNFLAAEKPHEQADIKQLLLSCAEQTPSLRNTEYYAKIILNSKKARQIQDLVAKVSLDGVTAENADDTVNHMISELFEVAENRNSKKLKSLGEFGLELFGSYCEPEKSRVDTGFARLDEKLKGMSAGNLIILAARPKVGKTAFALSIAENVAKSGKAVALFSLEMTGTEIFERFLCKMTGVPMNRLIDRSFNDKKRPQKVRTEEINKIADAIDKSHDLPIKINDNPACTVNDIRLEAKQLIMHHKARNQADLGLIIVDYLQLMRSDRKFDNRNLEVGAICRDLKCLSAELEVPILCLSQLNRTSNESTRPNSSELRDSGSIEQDANKVILMWCIEKNLNELGQVESKTIGVDVALNRRGTTGVTMFDFDGRHMEFTELAQIYAEQRTQTNLNWKDC